MLPWRPAGAGGARPATPRVPNGSAPSSPATDDSDSEESFAPPAYYFTQLREIYPDAGRRDALRAWDLNNKDNWKGATEQERVQGAILKMQEVLDPPVTQPQKQESAEGNKRKIEQSNSTAGGRGGKGKEKALFLSSDDEDDSEQVKVEEPEVRANKRRRIIETAVKDKGKGKAREVDLVISDDDDESDLVIVESAGTSNSAGKGRGKGKQPRLHSQEIDLSTVGRREPSPPRKARTPSLPPPSPLAQLLQLLPDLLPSHAEELLASPQFEASLDKIIDHLLSIPGGYPKVEEKKENRPEPEIDWSDLQALKRREGEKTPLYKRLALDQLYTDFPSLPSTIIKSTYLSPEIASTYFAPAYLSLYSRLKAGDFDSQKLKSKRKPPKKITKWVSREGEGNGDQRGGMVEIEERDEQLDKEMDWVKQKLLAQRKEIKMKQKLEAEEQAEQARIEKTNEKARKSGKAKECQCCFEAVAVQNTVACEQGHLFCLDCAIKNASFRIGDQHYTLPCMTDCEAVFSPKEYSKWLPKKMQQTLERLQADKELEMAFKGVEGFEKCPFCPFAMYIENENERLFRCLNESECGKVSCRKCKKEGHVPLSCEEADRDSRMGGVHAVEDAMTEALIRSCPKCSLRYVKSEACNKVTCSRCGTLSCYICGVAVKDYNHFNQSAPGSGAAGSSKCPLWDDTEVRHFNEVEEARKKAQASLDSKTQEYAEKLAAEKPDRQAPRNPPPLPAAAAAGLPGAAWNQYPYLPGGGVVYAPPVPHVAPRARARGRQPTAAERAIALQAAQLEAMNRQQQVIIQQQQALQQALQFAGMGHGHQGGGAYAVPAYPLRAAPQAAPAPVDPETQRRARLEAAMRRANQG